MNKKLIKSLWAVSAAFLISTGHAQVPMPPIQHYGTTQFISGGIGVDECNALRAEACHWPLQLMFSEVQAGTTVGAWVSDVDVKITDKDGNAVLSIITEGPLLLVKLPAGAYTLTANYQGKVAKRTLAVREGRSETVSVHWVGK